VEVVMNVSGNYIDAEIIRHNGRITIELPEYGPSDYRTIGWLNNRHGIPGYRGLNSWVLSCFDLISLPDTRSLSVIKST